jgi:3-dehydroquinate dehydratase II
VARTNRRTKIDAPRRRPARLSLFAPSAYKSGTVSLAAGGAGSRRRYLTACRNIGKLMAKTIYVLNGPNLNLLGTREPETYGTSTLKDVEKLCRAAGQRHGIKIEFRQSNHEGTIVDWIQEAGQKKAIGVLLNPAGYTTTSIAILDAIYGIKIPVIEVHISNIHAREEFRNDSFVSIAAKAVICGFGVHGYVLAIDGLANLTGTAGKR